MSLNTKAVEGVRWTAISSGVIALVQLLLVVILARLLEKDEFGLYATVTVVLGLARFFVEAGLGAAGIHKQDISKRQLGTAYVINIVQGWGVFGVVFLSAGSIASFYGEEKLILLVQVSSLLFLIQPLGRQYAALLQKDLRFDSLAKFDIVAAILGLCIATSTAYLNFGAFSFVLGQIGASVLRTICLLICGVKVYGFNCAFSRREASFFFRFGAFQIGENVVNYLNGQLDVILIGKVLGQEELGMFYAAKQLVVQPLRLVNPIITKVALPFFAKLQGDAQTMKQTYLKLIHLLAFILLGVYATMASFAPEIVQIVLGPKWTKADSLVSILAFYAIQRGIGSPIGSLILAKGRVDIGFYWNLALLIYMPMMIFLGSLWGLEGIAWSLVIAFLILQLPGWYFVTFKLTGASLSEYYGRILKMLFQAAFCFIGTCFFDEIFIRLFVGLIGGLLFCALNFKMIEIMRTLKPT